MGMGCSVSSSATIAPGGRKVADLKEIIVVADFTWRVVQVD